MKITNLEKVCELLEKGKKVEFVSYDHKGRFIHEEELMDLFTYNKELSEELQKKGYEVMTDNSGIEILYKCEGMTSLPKFIKTYKGTYDIKKEEEFLHPFEIEQMECEELR